jgi:hypothetical protein
LWSLLAALSALCLLLGAVTWHPVRGGLLFCCALGLFFIHSGIAVRSTARTALGMILVSLGVAFFVVPLVGAAPALVLGMVVSVVLSLHNQAREQPYESWLALASLLACAALSTALYCDRSRLGDAYYYDDHFSWYLCGGLSSGILLTAPYVVIRIFFTRLVHR